MRATRIPILICAILFSACDKDENAAPRPPLGDNGLLGQEHHFKVKADEWSAYGIPGDDTHGYDVIKTVNIIDEGVLQSGTVRVYVKRSANNWAELPLLAHQGAPLGLNWRFDKGVGKVQVMIDRYGEKFSPPDQMMTFKVVVFAN
ncbi:MAG: hypothetical protein KIT10_13095 [Flavobacteriales bacterium]|nr:hypothetical protein [Flavobacteriales bacterium]